MLFDPFESVVLFLSVWAVNYVVQDGKSNLLEGMILLCLCVWTFTLTVFLSELTHA
jgi:Ca2+:H+ antiporter